MTYQMIKSIRPLYLLPLTALCLVSAAAQAQTSPPHGTVASMSQGTMHEGTNGSDHMKYAMMMGMDSMLKMSISGNIDKDFAMMMKMHHQQGVDMAKIQLAQGKSPVMKAMAKQIIAAQTREIARFNQWIALQN